MEEGVVNIVNKLSELFRCKDGELLCMYAVVGSYVIYIYTYMDLSLS